MAIYNTHFHDHHHHQSSQNYYSPRTAQNTSINKVGDCQRSNYVSKKATLRDALHWLPIRQRVEFKLSVLVFNCMHNLAPSYLSTMCQLVANSAGRRHLRSAARGDLAVPTTRTLRYGPRSFAVTGPSTWNSLPAPIRSSHLISAFRRDLKTKLFARAYH